MIVILLVILRNYCIKYKAVFCQDYLYFFKHIMLILYDKLQCWP